MTLLSVFRNLHNYTVVHRLLPTLYFLPLYSTRYANTVTENCNSLAELTPRAQPRRLGVSDSVSAWHAHTLPRTRTYALAYITNVRVRVFTQPTCTCGWGRCESRRVRPTRWLAKTRALRVCHRPVQALRNHGYAHPSSTHVCCDGGVSGWQHCLAREWKLKHSDSHHPATQLTSGEQAILLIAAQATQTDEPRDSSWSKRQVSRPSLRHS